MQHRFKPNRILAHHVYRLAILSVLLALFFSPFSIIQTSTVKAVFIPNDQPCPPDSVESPIDSTQKECIGAGGVDAVKATQNSGCDIGFAECIADVVYLFTVGIGSAAAYVGAWVFGIATALSLSSTAYALDFLTQGWTVIRDMANMFFVLILVYIALTIMFRADTHDTAKKLAWVIVIALIINFSFFFTRVVIDAGNLLAVQFYNAIPTASLNETVKTSGLTTGLAAEATSLTGLGTNTKDLSSPIMNGIGVQNILGTDAFKKFRDANLGAAGFFTTLITLSFLYIVLGAMFFMLAAAFLTVGIKFIVRIAVLWLLIIASPLAFVANTLQEGKKWYKQWQSALITHAFYPAFFLFIFYILTLFMKDLTKGGTILEQTFLDAGSITGGGLAYLAPLVATIAVRLGFVLALLYIGLKASEQMGVMGAQFAEHVAGKVNTLARFSGGLPLRGALSGSAAANRFLIGGTALRASRSSIVQNLRADTMLGRAVKGTLKNLAGASYDVRGVSGASSVLSGGGLLDIGKAGGKGGYAKAMENRAKYIESEAKGLKADEVDIRNAQETYIKNFEYGGEKGKIAYDARLAELTRAKADALRDQHAAEARGDQAAIKAAKEHQKTADKNIKELQEGGKEKIEKAAKERIKRFAERMGGRNIGNLGLPSRGSIEGAAKVLKLVTEKSATEKLADAAKQLAKEDGGGEPTPPGSGGSGGGGKGSGGGGETKATSKNSATKGDSHGAHASMEEHTEKMVSSFERMAQRLERTVEHGFQGLGEQLHQESKRAESQTLRANSAELSGAATTTRPVAAVPTGGNVATLSTPPTQTQFGTPPISPKPATNDNLPPQNINKAA